jgi:hypothetical protein
MFNSDSFCSIDGCNNLGTFQHSNGKMFCRTHWNEENTPECDVPGCRKDGVIHSGSAYYCVSHAWQSQRTEGGLRHPPEFTPEDDKLLASMGIKGVNE